jgi:transposase
MTIVGGFDVHRRQITYNVVDTDTGEVRTGRIAPADRPHLRVWLAQQFNAGSDVHIALESGTGWRYVVEEITAAGLTAHLAEPAETSARTRVRWEITALLMTGRAAAANVENCC